MGAGAGTYSGERLLGIAGRIPMGWSCILREVNMMNHTQFLAIWKVIAALEAVAVGVPVDHEIWMLKEKLKVSETAIK